MQIYISNLCNRFSKSLISVSMLWSKCDRVTDAGAWMKQRWEKIHNICKRSGQDQPPYLPLLWNEKGEGQSSAKSSFESFKLCFQFSMWYSHCIIHHTENENQTSYCKLISQISATDLAKSWICINALVKMWLMQELGRSKDVWNLQKIRTEKKIQFSHSIQHCSEMKREKEQN